MDNMFPLKQNKYDLIINSIVEFIIQEFKNNEKKFSFEELLSDSDFRELHVNKKLQEEIISIVNTKLIEAGWVEYKLKVDTYRGKVLGFYLEDRSFLSSFLIKLFNYRNIFRIIKLSSKSPIPRKYTGLVLNEDNSRGYYKKGKLHNINEPAFVHSNGDKYWYKDNKLHREDGPAIEFADGSVEYWLNGLPILKEELKPQSKEVKKLTKVIVFRHGTIPANYTGLAIIYDYDYGIGFQWCRNGLAHRKDGPAKIWLNGTKTYYINGKYHREDGPAKLAPGKDPEYYIRGVRYKKSTYYDKINIMFKNKTL